MNNLDDFKKKYLKQGEPKTKKSMKPILVTEEDWNIYYDVLLADNVREDYVEKGFYIYHPEDNTIGRQKEKFTTGVLAMTYMGIPVVREKDLKRYKEEKINLRRSITRAYTIGGVGAEREEIISSLLKDINEGAEVVLSESTNNFIFIITRG